MSPAPRPFAPDVIAQAASAVAVGVGSVVLLGWLADSASLRAAFPGLFLMKANASLCFVLAGAALWLARPEAAGGPRHRAVARALAAAVALVGGVTVAEYALDRDLAVDRVLAHEASGPDALHLPDRMSPLSALGFLLYGVALLAVDVRARSRHPAQALAIAVAFIGAVALVGHLYGVSTFYVFGPPTRMAAHAAFAFVALGAGLLAARPGHGVTAQLLSEGAGGAMARRLLPAVVALPVAVGWVRLAGQHAGLYEPEVGVALLTVGTVVILVGVVWLNARHLDRADARRQEAERALATSERRYRQVTESALDAIIVSDQEGVITLCNPAAERAFGRRCEELVGRAVSEIVPPKYREAHRRGLRRYVEAREARVVGRVVELEGLRADGTVFPLEMSLSAVDLGGELQFLGVMRDQTERARMRAALLQSEKLASLGLLSAGIAHEINNPMAYVANNLHVLERDVKSLVAVLDVYEASRDALARVDPEAAERARALAEDADLEYVRTNIDRLLGRTREGVRRVTRIVESLRSLARTERTDPVRAELPELVGAGLEMIRGRLQRRNIRVETDWGDDPTVFCVPTQLAQVLLNLLTNAMHAIESTGRDGGLIRVTSRKGRGEQVIEVADDGCGIKPEDLPRLFDPFFTTKPVGEGTGLGLAITHSIVEGHGGRVEVESRPGEGATFRLRLPLEPKREAA